jgi:hypothetical protein
LYYTILYRDTQTPLIQPFGVLRARKKDPPHLKDLRDGFIENIYITRIECPIKGVPLRLLGTRLTKTISCLYPSPQEPIRTSKHYVSNNV